MPTKVLLTGITGFIGSRTAIQLLNAGYEVTGTLRSPSKIDHIKKVIAPHTEHMAQLQFAQADLEDEPAKWQKLMEGMDYVLHIASPLPLIQPKDDTEIIRQARNGVLNVLEAAAKTGIKRTVVTSSTGSVVMGKTKRKVFTEEDWTDPNNKKDTSPYYRSKTLAEQAAWDFIEKDQSGMELSVVNPALVLGPIIDQEDYGTSAALILKLLDGSVPAIPNVGYPLVDVRSVADLHIKAMTHPKAAGQRFICSVDYMTMREIAEVLRANFPDRKIPKASLPNFLVRLFSLIDKEAAPLVLELGAERKVDNTKAKTWLDWNPIPAKQAILDTANSLTDLGFV